MVNELFIMRWPRNLSAVYVNGATIRYAKDQSVYYANEVLSPGQIICSWHSRSDYISSGIAPSLPLLKINKHYELSIKMEADNDLPVEFQINFLDAQQALIHSQRSTQKRLAFIVPNGTVSYAIHLVNLKHHWLQFEYLSISEIGVAEKIVATEFRQHYEWVHVHPGRGSNHKTVRLILNRGPRSILPVSLHESTDYDQIFIYTDGQEINRLIKSLSQQLQFKHDAQITIEAGLGYYSLPSEVGWQIEVSLKNKPLGGINNDKLDY